ncbi:MAG: ATP-binding cassette domain-containing protein [Thermoanaerobaculia bacterium]
MSLLIDGLVLPLAHFALEATIELTRKATALYGPSGSGKTSLLEVVAGLRRPVAGRVVLDGRNLTDLPARDRRIGYVPQDDSLFPHLSVRRNILYGARGDDTLPHIAAVLDIEQILDRSTMNLSGGERKRVALARALLSRPELLLLDEPLSGVDEELRNRVLDYLARIREEFPIPLIYVTHDISEAQRLCDEVVRMEKGKITRAWPLTVNG